MSKRKRSSDVVDGVGATLARLKEEAQDSNRRTADDDEGWTTIGAPKKRRTNEVEPQNTSWVSPANHVDDRAVAEPTNGDASEKGSDETAEKAAHMPNPFAMDIDGKMPANPFSTKPQDGSAPKDSVPVVSPAPRASSEERKQAKAERRKERKVDRHYPVIEHSHLARLKAHVKITDLQSLVLYILADGSAPQWVAVKNRTHIQQVVVLMVPGLEAGMFNGKVPLESTLPSEAPSADKSEAEAESPSATNEVAKFQRLAISPDDYYPAALKRDHLPDALKPLCDMFPNVWPVKGTAEQRAKQFFRIHSPIHTMLTSQIPKTSEEKKFKKNQKGPVPQNTKHWNDKRTPITQYVADLADQLENNIVPHPAWFETPEAREAERQRRKVEHQASDDGWVDTRVDSLDDGVVKNFQQGSLTEGRGVIAVDCEMCKAENDEQVLTRISLTNWDGEVLLDELVKPDVPIKDYLTQYVL